MAKSPSLDWITKERLHRALSIFYYGVAVLVLIAIAAEMRSRPLFDKTIETETMWEWQHGLLEEGVWSFYAMELLVILCFVGCVFIAQRKKLFWPLLAPYIASCFFIFQIFFENNTILAILSIAVITLYMVACGVLFVKKQL